MTQQSPKSLGETAQPRSLGRGGKLSFIFFLLLFPFLIEGDQPTERAPSFFFLATVVSSPTHCFPFWGDIRDGPFSAGCRLPLMNSSKNTPSVFGHLSRVRKRRKRKEEEKVSQKTVERGQKGKIFMPRVFFCFVVREKYKLCFGAEGKGGGGHKDWICGILETKEREKGEDEK